MFYTQNLIYFLDKTSYFIHLLLWIFSINIRCGDFFFIHSILLVFFLNLFVLWYLILIDTWINNNYPRLIKYLRPFTFLTLILSLLILFLCIIYYYLCSCFAWFKLLSKLPGTPQDLKKLIERCTSCGPSGPNGSSDKNVSAIVNTMV